MPRIYGIDLGAHSVKVTELEGSFGRFQVVGHRERRVPEPEDGPATLDERIAVLGEMLDEEGDRLQNAQFGAGFPTEFASVRVVELPFGDRAKVEQALQFEVEGLVPFDLEDMVLASRILHIAPGNSLVLAAMAPRDRVGGVLGDLKVAGADPKVLVVDADMLGDLAGPGVQAVIDLGHARTLVTLCQDAHAVSARAIDAGGRDLTRALADAFQLDFATAEARKHASGVYADGPRPAAAAVSPEAELDDIDLDAWADEPTNPHKSLDPTIPPEPLVKKPTLVPSPTEPGVDAPAPERSANEVLRDAVLPLLLDIRTTLLNFEDTHGVEIEEVVLCGGGAELGGLREWLGAVLGVPVRMAPAPEGAGHLAAPGRFCLSASSANKAGGGKGRLLDLRVDAFTFKGDLQVLGTVMRYSAAALALLMLGGIGWFGWQVVRLNAEVSALEGQIAEQVVGTFPDVSRSRVDGDASMALAIMQERTMATTAQVDALGSILSEEPPVTAALRDISDGMPTHQDAPLDVSELSISPTSISMKVETNGYEEAAKIETALKRKPKFAEARKGDESKRSDKVRFTITIPLEGTDTEEG